MAAQSAAATAAVARQRRAQPNGWWGMVLFLCAEVTLFGTLLATYFYLDFDAARWPPAGIKPPEIVLPLVATGALITTSVPMFLASRAARAGKRGMTVSLIALALLVQCGYLAGQILLFRHDLLQFSPKDSAYGSIYFTMLAAHHAHVVLGILLDIAVLWQLVIRGLTNYWLIGARSVALYWHVVNVLAVLVVLTQLSPSL
jgi:cytochrome c oxidase subunit 3/cytochrome c oxidase subunit I+III